MNILYLSCHSILEYDELKLFEELGYDYFSIGAYINPQTPHDPKRPALNGKYHEHLASVAMVHNQDNLHEEQIEWADVIIIMHVPQWIEKNWEKMKHKRVIWRSIGQSIADVEMRLKPYRDQGLEIVRYSPMEENIPGYIGQDATIRFYKDPTEFSDWVGGNGTVMTVGQSVKQRGAFCNYDTFHAATEGLPRKLFGPNNSDCEESAGELSYDGLKKELRDNRVFFYTGTHPASYTLGFIEAMMTGIPIVSIGAALGNSRLFQGQRTFEVPGLIQNGHNGYVSDNIKELHEMCKNLIENPSLARQISENGRRTAIDIFGYKTIREQWREYLEKK